MTPTPIVYVRDMYRARRFYAALSPDPVEVSTGPVWSEYRLGGAPLALHLVDTLPPAPGRVGLAFAASEPLEDLVARLAGFGIAPEGDISDEAFGRSLLLRDPDGLALQVNEHDPTLYARS